MNWIDNADSYICPRCRNEVGNPIKYGYKCPKCGFVAEQDAELAKAYEYGRADALKPISNLVFSYLINDEAKAVVVLDAIRNYIAEQIKEQKNE